MFSAATLPVFPPSSHAALPQSVLSLINPVSSMALINRTVHFLHMACQMLETHYYVLFLSFFSSVSLYLFPSFFSAFDTLFFSTSWSFYTSGFHTSDFALWIWLVWVKSRDSKAASVEGSSVLYLLLHSSRSIAAFNGASACVNAVCSPLITCPWTWLKSQNICVCSLLRPTCPCLYVPVFF